MRWPLLEALRSARSGVDGPTLMLLAVIGLGWAGSAAAGLRIDWWMARTHFDVPWAAWALTQPLPFMYTMENRWEALPEGPPDTGMAEACEAVPGGMYAHQAPHVLFAPASRTRWHRCGQPGRAHLVSAWRELRYESTWFLDRDAQGVLHVERAP